MINKTHTCKKKESKSTISKPKDSKQRKDDWRTKYTFWNQKGLPVAALEDLADKFIATVKSDPSIMTLSKLYYICDVSPSSMVKFLERSEKLKEAKEYARFVIGMNREEGALYRKIDGNIMKFMQGHYDDKWKEEENRQAELRKNNTSEHTTKIVILEKFENVEPKKDNNET